MDRRLYLTNLYKPLRIQANPGSFNYERYAAFQGIYQQVFLKPETYVLLPAKKENLLTHFLFVTGESVLNIITKYIPGEKEAGLAEALLVGYKDDLDKTLVQSYNQYRRCAYHSYFRNAPWFHLLVAEPVA